MTLDRAGKVIGIGYGLILYTYLEYIQHGDMSSESRDTHLLIFWTLLVIGVLALAAVAVPRLRS